MLITKNDCEGKCPKCLNNFNIELKGLRVGGDYLYITKMCPDCGVDFEETYDISSSYESTEYYAYSEGS